MVKWIHEDSQLLEVFLSGHVGVCQCWQMSDASKSAGERLTWYPARQHELPLLWITSACTEPGCLCLQGFPILGWDLCPRVPPSVSSAVGDVLSASPITGSLLLLAFPGYWAFGPGTHVSVVQSTCSCSTGALVISGASEDTPEMISISIAPKETPKRCFPPSPPEVAGWDILFLVSPTLETPIPAFLAAFTAKPMSGLGVSNLRQSASSPGSFLQGLCAIFEFVSILSLTIWLFGSIFLSISLNNMSSKLESDVPQMFF